MEENKNLEKTNKEKMQALYQNIQSEGKFKKIKNKLFNYDEYNNYLKNVCEYNIRSILDKYLNEKALTIEEEETIRKYLFFSSNFYAGKAEGPDDYDLNLQSCFGSGNFNYEELELINKISEDSKQHNKRR